MPVHYATVNVLPETAKQAAASVLTLVPAVSAQLEATAGVWAQAFTREPSAFNTAVH